MRKQVTNKLLTRLQAKGQQEATERQVRTTTPEGMLVSLSTDHIHITVQLMIISKIHSQILLVLFHKTSENDDYS